MQDARHRIHMMKELSPDYTKGPDPKSQVAQTA